MTTSAPARSATTLPAVWPPGNFPPVNASPIRLTAVGVALRHFTDSVRDITTMPTWALHVATTVLTKQLEPHLRADDPVTRCRDLLLDPERPAWSTGTPAHELLGDAWDEVADTMSARIDATLGLARIEGDRRALTRFARSGTTDTTPWWGTHLWDTTVARHISRIGRHPLLESVLRTTPEYADSLTLSRVLALSHAVGR